VSRAASRLGARARAGEGPGFIEAVTARWYGHVDWREDIDVGVNRSTADLANWRARDPVRRLVDALRTRGEPVDAWVMQDEKQLRAEIDSAWQQAMQDPYPPESALLGRVYASGEAR
jgi:pyruvate dehydrogenase E1 component alpha subunit